MNTNGRFGLIVLAAALVGSVGAANGAQQSGGGSATVRAAIQAANKRFLEGEAKHDTALVSSTYSEDAEVFPPNADTVTGRAAIQKMWQTVLDSGIAAFELSTSEVESAGDLAYEVGTYAMKTKDGKVVDRGKYCVVWKRVGGQWLLHRDIWSTSLPEVKK